MDSINEMNEAAQKVKRNNLMNSTFSKDGSRASPRPQRSDKIGKNERSANSQNRREDVVLSVPKQQKQIEL